MSRSHRGLIIAASTLGTEWCTRSGIFYTRVKMFAALLVACSVIAGAQASKASGQVITNEWQQFVTFPVNTCNGEFVPVFSGLAHVVQRLQPDGTLVTTTNGHFVATGTLGNRYQLNWQERFVSDSGQTTFTSRQMIVSEGSAPNHLVTFTFEFPPGTFTATERCFG